MAPRRTAPRSKKTVTKAKAKKKNVPAPSQGTAAVPRPLIMSETVTPKSPDVVQVVTERTVKTVRAFKLLVICSVRDVAGRKICGHRCRSNNLKRHFDKVHGGAPHEWFTCTEQSTDSIAELSAEVRALRDSINEIKNILNKN